MIAVLGATGYIGFSLAKALARSRFDQLTLFARSPIRLAAAAWPAHVSIGRLADFDPGAYDLVINCIGAGDPARVQALGKQILDVSRSWDERILDGLRSRYVFISSGIVHADMLVGPDALDSPYRVAKLRAETAHRALADRPILDLRVFGYADQAIALDGCFLLAELARAVVEGTPFRTTRADMVRDYAGVEELVGLIRCWEQAGSPNTALDLYTRSPVGKIALLDAARERFSLAISWTPVETESATGKKPAYVSTCREAAGIGYVPVRDSLTIVLDVLTRLRARR